MVSDRQLDLLSTKGRDVISLLKLIPGVTPGNDAESLGGTFGTSLPAINGQSSGFNQVSLDGQSGTDIDIVGSFNETTSMDAIAEVKVLMNNYQAEYGRNASAVINMVSKSGTQQFHGSAYWYKRHEQFNAGDFFNNRTSVPKPRYRYNIFGGTIGGPVYIPGLFNTSKTKLFAFYSREDQITYTPANLSSVTMPTQLERNGDFSQTLDVSGKVIPIKDPTTGQSYVGNVIPPSMINKNGQAMLNIFNMPNFFNRTISGGNYNYQWQQTAEVPKKQNLLKLDYNPTDKDRISFRPRNWWADTRQYNIYGWFMTNWDFMKEHYLFTEESVETNWTRIISPTIVNELGVSFRRLREQSPETAAYPYTPMLRSTRGLTGLGQWNPASNPAGIIPQMSFGGVPGNSAANLSGEAVQRIPIDARDFRYTVLDNVSKSLRNHDLKAGIYYEFNVGSEGARGNVYGRFAWDKDTNNVLDSNHPYSNAILGNFTSYSEANRKTTAKNYSTLTEWFVQDSWKARRRLTLELGMRFTVASPYWFPNGDASAFYYQLYNPANSPKLIQPTLSSGKRVGLNPVTGALMPTPAIGFYAPNSGDPLNGLRAASEPGYDHFNDGSGLRLSPRFGFAWDVFGTGKTAIRGGAAITRNPLLANGGWSGSGYSTPPTQYNPTLYYGNLTTFTTSAGLLSPVSVVWYGPKMKTTTIYSTSVTVQQDLGHSFLVSLGYVGNRGLHLSQTEDINMLPYGTRFLASSADTTNNGILPDNFLRPNPGFASITHRELNGISNYNALQSTLQRRFTKGFQVSSAYTWSKAMSNGGTRPRFQNARIWSYGKSGDDRTHVLTVNFTYDLPKLSKLAPNPVVKAVFDDWELSGIGTFVSGAPSGFSFSTVSGADLTGGGDGQRVVMVAAPVISNKTFDKWFNTASVALPAKGEYGNAATDEFRGPGTNNWDLTAFKNIKIKEKANFQLRWEAYNVFNHTQWSGVNSAARFDNTGAQVNALFGTVTSARAARVMQGSLRFQF
jgi:hypothetical protein